MKPKRRSKGTKNEGKLLRILQRKKDGERERKERKEGGKENGEGGKNRENRTEEGSKRKEVRWKTVRKAETPSFEPQRQTKRRKETRRGGRRRETAFVHYHSSTANFRTRSTLKKRKRGKGKKGRKEERKERRREKGKKREEKGKKEGRNERSRKGKKNEGEESKKERERKKKQRENNRQKEGEGRKGIGRGKRVYIHFLFAVLFFCFVLFSPAPGLLLTSHSPDFSQPLSSFFVLC